MATRKPVKHRYNDAQAAALQDTKVSVEEISQPDGSNVLVDPLLHHTDPRSSSSAASCRAPALLENLTVPDLRRALKFPARLIAENAGADGSIVIGKLLESKNSNWGFDAQEGEYKDLVKAGIIDPTKVVRCALQYAASVAGLLITTEAMVAERPKKEAALAGAHGGGMGGMGDMDF